jgi:hypothetical protein
VNRMPTAEVEVSAGLPPAVCVQAEIRGPVE